MNILFAPEAAGEESSSQVGRLLIAHPSEGIDAKSRHFYLSQPLDTLVLTTINEVVTLKDDDAPFGECTASVDGVLGVMAHGFLRLDARLCPGIERFVRR